MQAGSAIKRRASLRSSSRVSRSLAGFEKYANNLVRQYEKHQAPPSNETKEAIQTVVNYIESFYTLHNDSHWNDVDTTDQKCNATQGHDECINSYYDEDELDRTKTATEAARVLHVACRINETCEGEQKGAKCAEYDAYRSQAGECNDLGCHSATFPGCASGGRTSSDLDNASISTTDTDKQTQMENCLEEVESWHRELYTLYIGCDRGDGDSIGESSVSDEKSCSDYQKEFEEAHCTYQEKLNMNCIEGYDLCMKTTQTYCQEWCTGSLKVNVNARKAENETGERILCLLKVLLDTSDDQKKVELEICKTKNYSNTDHFNISCEIDDGAAIRPDKCDGVESPACTQDFLLQYYAGAWGNMGAHSVPYNASCDCTVCTLVLGAGASKTVNWIENDDGKRICELLPLLQSYPDDPGCDKA